MFFSRSSILLLAAIVCSSQAIPSHVTSLSHQNPLAARQAASGTENMSAGAVSTDLDKMAMGTAKADGGKGREAAGEASVGKNGATAEGNPAQAAGGKLKGANEGKVGEVTSVKTGTAAEVKSEGAVESKAGAAVGGKAEEAKKLKAEVGAGVKPKDDGGEKKSVASDIHISQSIIPFAILAGLSALLA
uniref:Uncharacterized protein n=1 Tax=Phakopsora pachyrhizi TaxID=170000 RepID=A0A0S1MKG5_PHAPC